MDLVLDYERRIARLGLRVRASAVGQAAAAILARQARSRDLADIADTLDRLESWLRDEADAPDWPDLELLAPARAYPARHGALLLPWKAASAALSTVAAAG
jgi:NifU-like protein involved in Fe-S cluster formation